RAFPAGAGGTAWAGNAAGLGIPTNARASESRTAEPWYDAPWMQRGHSAKQVEPNEALTGIRTEASGKLYLAWPFLLPPHPNSGWASLASSWYNRVHGKQRAAQTPDVTGGRQVVRPCKPPLRHRAPLVLAQPQSEKAVGCGTRRATFSLCFFCGRNAAGRRSASLDLARAES